MPDWISTPNAKRRARCRNLTLKDDVWEMLAELAKSLGVSRSDALSQIVRAKAGGVHVVYPPVDSTRRGYVYEIEHTESGRLYVGSTLRPKVRWREHQRMAAAGSFFPVHAAIRTHGVTAFRFRVLCALPSIREAQEFENNRIATLGLTDPARGYNASGGQ